MKDVDLTHMFYEMTSRGVIPEQMLGDRLQNQDRYTVQDNIWHIMRRQGEEIVKKEPSLHPLIHEMLLQHGTFGEALVFNLAQKLAGKILTNNYYIKVMSDVIKSASGDLERLAMEDLLAVERRDPACPDIVHAFIYFKGYKSIQSYRFSHFLWTTDRKELAMVFQARCSEVFAVDIHPAARIAGGLMIDHATGVVVGETAVVGRDCSFLHGVTLGGTGTSKGHDRHPKLGCNVFLGSGVSVLGNIYIGDYTKVGSGSIVLRPLPAGSTAVGSPAVIKNIDPRYAQTATASGEHPVDTI